jgi:sugar lactone lactonase YvrE
MDPDAASDIAVDAANVLISDVSRSRVYLLDRETGAKIQKWRRIGTAHGVLLENGEPLITMFDSGQIVRLNKDDRKARTVVAEGLNGPVDIAWANATAVYVSEATSGSVSRVDLATGAMVRIASGLAQPEGIAIMRDGRLAVVEAAAQRVTAIDTVTGDAEFLATGLPIGAAPPEAPGPIFVPTGIVAGSDGILYLASDRNHSLIRLVPGA